MSTQPPEPPARRPAIIRWLKGRSARGWILAGLAIMAFGTAAAMQMHWGKRGSLAVITVAAGKSDWPRKDAFENLALLATKHQLWIRSIDTKGSAEAIEAVENGQADLGIVPGGIDFTNYKHLRQVVSLHVLPLHLLVKKEHAAKIQDHLGSLRGMRIYLGGGPDTGAYWLARDVLEFAGLHLDRGDYTIASEADPKKVADSTPDALPDVFFLTATIPSPVVSQLVAQDRYRLIPLPFHDAFALRAVSEGVDHPIEDSADVDAPLRVRKEHIPDAVVPAFTYAADPAVPPQPLHTLGMTALLIANENVKSDVVDRLLEVLFHTRYARLIRPPLDMHRLEEPPELPWHSGSLAYLARSRPLLTGDILNTLAQWATVGAPLLGGLVFVRQWVKQRFRFASERSFESYIAKVSRLERMAIEMSDSGSVSLKEIEHLERDLGHLKVEALARFARGEMDGETMMTNFLTHVSDARDHLGRIAARRQRAISLEQAAEGAHAAEPHLVQNHAGPAQPAKLQDSASDTEA